VVWGIGIFWSGSQARADDSVLPCLAFLPDCSQPCRLAGDEQALGFPRQGVERCSHGQRADGGTAAGSRALGRKWCSQAWNGGACWDRKESPERDRATHLLQATSLRSKVLRSWSLLGTLLTPAWCQHHPSGFREGKGNW
jgi:hypothetical protein